jgi:hypothetical protein
MNHPIATQIRDKAAKYYVAGIVAFSAIVTIIATVIVIVNHNS